jgi:hypothetical protein
MAERAAALPIEAVAPELDRRQTSDRRDSRRGGRRLEDDKGWQDLLVSLSQQLDALFETKDWTFADGARASEFSKSAILDIINCRTDPKLSTLYRIVKASGRKLVLRFHVLPSGR